MDLGPPIPIGLEAGQTQLPLPERKRPSWALEEDVQYINEEMAARRLIEAHPDYQFLVYVAGAANQTVQAMFDPDVLDHAIRHVTKHRRDENNPEQDQEDVRDEKIRRQINLLEDNIKKLSAIRVIVEVIMWPVYSGTFHDYYNWNKQEPQVSGYDDMFRNDVTFADDKIVRRIENDQYFDDVVVPIRRALSSVEEYNKTIDDDNASIQSLQVEGSVVEESYGNATQRKVALKDAITQFASDMLQFAQTDASNILPGLTDFNTFVPSVRRGNPMKGRASAIPYWAEDIKDTIVREINHIDPGILSSAPIDWADVGRALDRRLKEMKAREQDFQYDIQAERTMERRMRMRSAEAERRLTRPQNTGLIRLAPNVVSAIATSHALLKNSLPNHYAGAKVSTLQHSPDVGPLFAELVARQMQRNRDGAPLSYTLDRSRASALQDQAFVLRQMARFRVEGVGRRQRVVSATEARGPALVGAAVQGLRDAW